MTNLDILAKDFTLAIKEELKTGEETKVSLSQDIEKLTVIKADLLKVSEKLQTNVDNLEIQQRDVEANIEKLTGIRTEITKDMEVTKSDHAKALEDLAELKTKLADLQQGVDAEQVKVEEQRKFNELNFQNNVGFKQELEGREAVLAKEVSIQDMKNKE